MEAWYKITTPRKEVRQGRSFNPDEFAIHLEQVIAGTAPEDYSKPEQFFARTCFTRALSEHTGMVLRRLSGKTTQTAPVMTLITQFGGGKTHTLATLYHLTNHGPKAEAFNGVGVLANAAGIDSIPKARIAVFVGNAWDPQPGRETPWQDVAWQLAGEKGIQELGPTAQSTPPGTQALDRVFKAANAPVLILFDEVLNFINRHRGMADQFHAFIQNLTVAMTGTTHGAAVISLPRSQVEMTEWDMQWQEKITKVVKRVAKDLIANDEAEISEVVRRRLFEDIGSERIRNNVAKAYADWCFERRAQLPPEWTAVDSATTESGAREYLCQRFASCYPFHPATLSVFQRKWQALSQYQQTRGTLAMLAQWISWAYQDGYKEARNEPLITIGSAPLNVPDFRSIVLGQLGETRLLAAIDADISGKQSHARALDADSKGVLRNIHQRVATTVMFESSGGQIDKVAHLPELRFALGEPEIDTTSIDSAASALESKSYFIRRVGSDGYKISHQPTMKKVVSDRRASLDEETEILPAMRNLVQKEFERNATIPLVPFPADGSAVQDTPKLIMVICDPGMEWNGNKALREQIAAWTKQRGQSPRLYPGALVWCLKRPGRDLRDKVEMWLAWKRVARELAEGTLGGDFDRSDIADIQAKVVDAENAAKDEVWGGYRFAAISDNKETSGLRTIDLGAGHSSSSDSMTGRVLIALKSQELLNNSVGAGYIERHWPPALKESGAWPLASLRQSFLNGSLTRLLDPEATLKTKIVEWIENGDFGLASNLRSDGTCDRLWFQEPIPVEEVTFEQGVYLVLKTKAKAMQTPVIPATSPESTSSQPSEPGVDVGEPWPISEQTSDQEPSSGPSVRSIRLYGSLPPETWNRLGTKILPKLRSGSDLEIKIELKVNIDVNLAQNFHTDIQQILADLGLNDSIRLE